MRLRIGESHHCGCSVIAEVVISQPQCGELLVLTEISRSEQRTGSPLPLAPSRICRLCRSRHNLHLIRNTFRYAGRQHWDELARDLRPSTAPTAEMAALRFEEFADKWGARYPAIIKLWRSAWEKFIPFLDYDVEIRKIICSTNAVESLNRRYRRAIRARGHFPTDQAALKCLYLVTRSLDPTGRGKTQWAMRWKPALNAFAITFEGRILPSNTN
jgi:transposase-like protein